MVNKLLGGHKISIQGIKKIIGNNYTDQPLTICEIGCGGGDNLQAIAGWCYKKNIRSKYIGIDIKKTCTDFAVKQYPALPVSWLTSDYAKADVSINKPDIIFSSLFCHHFKEDELINMFRWMSENSVQGFFINDLHRHVFAYYSIRMLTSFSEVYCCLDGSNQHTIKPPWHPSRVYATLVPAAPSSNASTVAA